MQTSTTCDCGCNCRVVFLGDAEGVVFLGDAWATPGL